MPSKRERKLISKNRSAHHEYFIDETFECGIELSGTEVKSIRERACQITDTFALIRGGECWLVGLHIHPYSHGGVWNRDPDRRRRLLLHRKEIDFLDGKLRNRGYALVPLELYFNTDGRVKLLLGLGRGKKLYDKREDMAKRDVQREIDRALKAPKPCVVMAACCAPKTEKNSCRSNRDSTGPRILLLATTVLLCVSTGTMVWGSVVEGIRITCPIRKFSALSPGLASQMALADTLYFTVSR